VSKRAYGSGSIRVKHGAWYGSWRTPEGRRTTRKLGVGTRHEAEAALRAMMQGDRDAIIARSQQARTLRPTQRVASPKKLPGVYFILAEGTGLVKIGHTGASTWAARLSAMQTGSAPRLTLHRFIPVRYRAAWLEGALHRQFVADRHHGEWFSIGVLDEIDLRTDEEVFAWLRQTGAWAARTPNGLHPRSLDTVPDEHATAEDSANAAV